jgi:hypothetical protein
MGFFIHELNYQFKMYEDNVLTLAKLDFLKIHFPNLEVFDE